MFDFNKFYKGLLNKDPFDNNYWRQFPEGKLVQFKEQTLSLLKENLANKDKKGLACTVAVLFWGGADEDYTDILLHLLDEKWHISEEDIVSVLEFIKDPKSVDKLYEVAVDVPDYDEMRALAKKCIYALGAVNTPEAIQKLKLLEESDDPIIKENATFQLEQCLKNN
ncbi:HEAT repeat domain-containing protein [Siphonobacter sp. SORGH_AS_1065]|uniref:HEAT repeat domain-containing protein n=1 Tax=Siphonobacter sp. SORGH_AS_1065 TaxID=3041795 RepID=UPI0027856C33|nr:HEAT repeat domain-containing protein [Siphonobacter sp. SORGH_AS_1065]MDQ1088913.1 HEAT repeat protein [Siphonobacter sp. SORGH_AS_1065]